MQPTWESDCGRVVLYHADCLEVLPTLEKGSIDAVVTDPPYGLGKKITRGGGWSSRGVHSCWDKTEAWDVAPGATVLSRIACLAEESIIWGGNYHGLGPSRMWLVWNKPHALPTMAKAELAWTSMDRNTEVFTHRHNGWKRLHPTEKPIALMEWCLSFISGNRVLDPYMGSGTTGVACIRTGRRFIGIELDQHYFEIAKKRIQDELAKHPPLEAVAA